MSATRKAALGIAALVVPAALMLAVFLMAVPFGVSSPAAPVPQDGIDRPASAPSEEGRGDPSPAVASPSPSVEQRGDHCLEPEHRSDPSCVAPTPSDDRGGSSGSGRSPGGGGSGSGDSGSSGRGHGGDD